MTKVSIRCSSAAFERIAVVNTFFVNFLEYVMDEDPTIVMYPLPSSIVALKDKSIRIKFFTVERTDEYSKISFLHSSELTLTSPYLEGVVAAYVQGDGYNESFQESYSIPSNVTKLTFQIKSDGQFQELSDEFNAYLVLEVIVPADRTK
jgi:hypothetical protein